MINIPTITDMCRSQKSLMYWNNGSLGPTVDGMKSQGQPPGMYV